MNKNQNVKINQMDKLQKELGGKLKLQLQEQYKARVEIGYVNIGYSVNRGFEVYIYENDYNYKKIGMNFIENVNVEEYVNFITQVILKKDYTEHIASPEEIYVINLLEEYQCKNIYLNDGILYLEGEEYACMDCIEELYFNKDNEILELVEDSNEKFVVDFANETIKYIDDEELEDNSKLVIDIDELLKCIDKINDITNKNIYYFMKSNEIWEVNTDTNQTGIWGKINEIKNFEINENNELVINFKNDETVFLCEDGGCM